MPFVTVGQENSGNIDLYYEDHGSGKPVVLIHGWPLSGASWEKADRGLAECGSPGHRIRPQGIRPVQPALHGYDYNTFAEDLRKLVTKLNLRDFGARRLLDGWRRSGPLLGHLRIGARDQGSVHRFGPTVPAEDG